MDTEKILYLLGESSFSREDEFVDELKKDIEALIKDITEILNSKMAKISKKDLQKFESDITRLRYSKRHLDKIKKAFEDAK